MNEKGYRKLDTATQGQYLDPIFLRWSNHTKLNTKTTVTDYRSQF